MIVADDQRARASEKEPCDRERESSHAHRANDAGSDGSRGIHRNSARSGDQNTTINLIIELMVSRRRALCLALKRAYEL